MIAQTLADLGSRTWIDRSDVAAILEASRNKVTEIAAAAGIRTRQLPGVKKVQFFRPDVERLAQSYTPANEKTEAAA